MFKNIQNLFSKLLKNGVVRSTSVLVGGTATAQALSLLALPILTRLYSPAEFSLLAVYVALLTILSAIACLRLEIAIPLPVKDSDAVNLLALAMLLATAVAVLSGFGVGLWGRSFFELLEQPDMHQYGWLLPFGVWLAGSYAALQFWATRRHRFGTIASTRLAQAGVGLSTQLGLGWLGVGGVGLLIGHALMSGAGVVRLIVQTAKQDMPLLKQVGISRLRNAFSDYRRFPQYSTFEALANNAAIQVPVILIATLAIGPEAGFVLLASRALGTPVTLIGNATAQVFLAKAPHEMREGRLADFTQGVLRGLAQVGVAPLIFIAIIAPPFFALIFGEEWRRAGELVAWMTPWFVLKLLSSPISMVMHIKMLQPAMLALMLTGAAVRVVITIAAYLLDPRYMAEGYAVSGAVHYLLAFAVYCMSAEIGLKGAVKVIRPLLLPCTLAVASGVLVISLMSS